MPSRGEWLQFIIATAIGCFVYWRLTFESDNPKVHVLGALVSGYFGLKLTVFLYVWARYGLKAARTMKLEP